MREAVALRDSLVRNRHYELANKFTSAINEVDKPKEERHGELSEDEIFGGRESEIGNSSGDEAHNIRGQYSGKTGNFRL